MLLWQKPYFCWEHSIIYYHLVLSFLDYAFIFSGVTFCRSPDDFILLTFRYLSKLQKWFWALTLSYSSQVGEKLFFFFFYISIFCYISQIIRGMIVWSRNDNIPLWDLAENVLQVCFLQGTCLLALISWKLYFIKIVFTLLFVLIKLSWDSLWLILNSRSMTPFFLLTQGNWL